MRELGEYFRKMGIPEEETLLRLEIDEGGGFEREYRV